MNYIRVLYTDELHPQVQILTYEYSTSVYIIRMNYIHKNLTNELHLYVVILSYGCTSSVYNLQIYFICILKITDLLEHQLPKKAKKICTSAEIKPPLVTLSPQPNRYLSQHLQNDHQREKPDHNNKNQAFNIKQTQKYQFSQFVRTHQ